MNRRSFLKTSCGAICLLRGKAFGADGHAPLARFGLVADVHFADRLHQGGKPHYSQSKQKLLEAVRVFNESNLDFIIELGDYKDQDEAPKKARTLAYLDEIESVMRQFNGPTYHVLGNHDMDSLSKQEFLSHTRNHGPANGKNYYAFMQGKLKCIVLDANYTKDGADYNAGNFNPSHAQIPGKEMQWLKKELADGTAPALVFVHQVLDRFSGVPEYVCIKNADEVVETLEKSNRVLAVFQGHHHQGNHSFRNGIHYFTMKALVEGSLPDNNSFAIVEVDKGLDIHIKGFHNCKDRTMKRLADTR
ncbi:MAG: metallophosphoesterase [Kiritimatiellaeota bacterium]|nr:metallophosphoesterase [Kiritimatiellota bacterium]